MSLTGTDLCNSKYFKNISLKKTRKFERKSKSKGHSLEGLRVSFKGTVMQIGKALTNDRLRVSKVP